MKLIISVGLCLVLLSGCGAEIAYKRGASARDLQISKATCEKSVDEKALEKCLEDNGWAIQKLDGSSFTDDELFATASVNEDNRMTAPKDKKEDAIKTTASLEADAPMIRTDEKTQQTVLGVAEKTDEAITAKSDSKQTSSTKVESANNVEKKTTTSSPPAKVKAKPSLFDTYVIKSWWKMGGTLKLLESNMDECNATLGTAHQPNKKTFTFTRAFAICLREKGWRGLIDKK